MKLEVVLTVWLTNEYCMKHVHDLWCKLLITFIMFMKIFLQFSHL